MFGYVRAYKPDITFSQFDIYKGIYCSLCKSIGKNYGLLARLTLSYDFTFFALFRMSVEEICPGFQKSRCSFNPAKKCLKCNLDDQDLRYTADVSMLMVYFKYLDNIQDLKGFKKLILKLAAPYFNYLGKRAERRCPEGFEILLNMHNRQIEAERNYDGNIDKACHPSAEALGKLLALGKTSQQDLIYDFGYAVGRWVYLIDAYDDYEKDKSSGSFNPFLAVSGFDYEYAEASLNLTAYRAASVYKTIKIHKYAPIIENILYDGLNYSFKAVTERKSNEKSV